MKRTQTQGLISYNKCFEEFGNKKHIRLVIGDFYEI